MVHMSSVSVDRFAFKAMLVISEHSILRQVFRNMAVHNVLKTSTFQAMQLSDTDL